MNSLKIFKLILLILVIAAIAVAALISIKYIKIYKNENDMKAVIDAIYEEASDNALEEIDANINGNRVIRNNRNTKN